MVDETRWVLGLRRRPLVTTALDCFFPDPLPPTPNSIAIYDVSPELTAYGIVNGKPAVLPIEKLEGRRVIAPLEVIIDLEAAAWSLLVYVARAERPSKAKFGAWRLHKPDPGETRLLVEKNGIRLSVIGHEYAARHATKGTKHALMIYNPMRVKLLAEPS